MLFLMKCPHNKRFQLTCWALRAQHSLATLGAAEPQR